MYQGILPLVAHQWPSTLVIPLSGHQWQPMGWPLMGHYHISIWGTVHGTIYHHGSIHSCHGNPSSSHAYYTLDCTTFFSKTSIGCESITTL